MYDINVYASFCVLLVCAIISAASALTEVSRPKYCMYTSLEAHTAYGLIVNAIVETLKNIHKLPQNEWKVLKHRHKW